MEYGKHPYLLISGMALKIKAEKTKFIWNPILEKAQNDLFTSPLIPEDPDGWLWEILDKTKERILRDCIVYKITGDSRYLEAMKKQLWCLIDEWPWIEKFHHEEVKLEADLRTGIIMYTLGLVYDWMYDDFSIEERRRDLSAIVDKGYPMLKKDIAAEIVEFVSNDKSSVIIINHKSGKASRFFTGSVFSKVVSALKDTTVCIVS